MFFQDLKILLGFMPSVSFAECTQCRNCSSEKNRQCPNCGASFPENYVMRTFTAQDIPEDMVEVFVTCPGCGRSLPPGGESCPTCGATFTREYASQSVQTNVTISQAFVNAEKIESFKPAAFISLAVALVVMACVFIFAEPLVGLFLLIPLMISLWEFLKVKQWLRWFASFDSTHDDFVSSRQKVNDALRLWRAVLAILAVLAVLLLVRWLIDFTVV